MKRLISHNKNTAKPKLSVVSEFENQLPEGDFDAESKEILEDFLLKDHNGIPETTVFDYKIGDYVYVSRSYVIVEVDRPNFTIKCVDKHGEMSFHSAKNVVLRFPEFLKDKYCKSLYEKLSSEDNQSECLFPELKIDNKITSSELYQLVISGREESYIPYIAKLIQRLEKHSEAVTYQNYSKIDEIVKGMSNSADNFVVVKIEDLCLKIYGSRAPSDLYSMYIYAKLNREIFFVHKEVKNTLVFWPKHIQELSRKGSQIIKDQYQLVERLAEKCRSLIVYTRGMKEMQEVIKYDYNINKIGNSGAASETTLKLSQSFIEKTKKIDDLSKITFNNTEKILIKNIELFLICEKFSLLNPFAIQACEIIKTVDAYDNVDGTTARRFLRDIGVLNFNDDLNFCYPILDNIIRGSNDVCKGQIDLSEVEDRHEKIRVDYGNIPVFAIDSEDTQLVDDGISIQTLDAQTSLISIHIADPTSLIKKNSTDLENTIDMASNIYTLAKEVSMLNERLRKTFNLEKSATEQDFKYTLTFSVKIKKTRKTTIIDTYINPGKIRNVIKTSYNEVDKLLGLYQEPQAVFYPFSLNHNPKESLSTKDIELFSKQIKALYDFSKHLKTQRVSDGSFFWKFTKMEVKLLNKPKNVHSIQHFNESPSIDNISYNPELMVSILSGDNSFKSNEMIAEYMILAGSIAGKYCKKLKVPSIYFNQESSKSLEKELELINRHHFYGNVEFKDYIKLKQCIKDSKFSTIPHYHSMLGLGLPYCKVTSPLRRAADMLVHIQIKERLLSKTIDKDRYFYPHELKKIIKKLDDSMTQINKLSQNSNKYWIISVLQRFEVEVKSGNAHNIMKHVGPKSRCPLVEEIKKVNGTPRPMFGAVVLAYNDREQVYKFILSKIGIMFNVSKEELSLIYSQEDCQFLPGENVLSYITCLDPTKIKVSFMVIKLGHKQKNH